MILIDKFNYLVDKNPNKIVFLGNQYKITFKEMSFNVDSIIFFLIDAGIIKGEKIAIICKDTKNVIELLLSCWHLELLPILIPYNSEFHERELFLNACTPDRIIANLDIAKGLSYNDKPIYPFESLEKGFGYIKNQIINQVEVLEDICLILFTSGTGGDPKGVKLTEKNLIESANGWNERILFSDKDLYLNCLPIHHVGGLSIFIRSILFNFRTIQLNFFNIEEIIKLINLKKVSLISMVPRMLTKYLDKVDNNISDSLRGIILSGGIASDTLMKRCIKYKIPVYKSYGSTETSSGVCGFWLNEFPYKFSSVGTPHENCKFRLRNSELEVAGPIISQGYMNNKFIVHWFETGDIANIDEDGFIYIKMRSDDIIVTGGENVSTSEIEKILCKNINIISAKVYSEYNEDWGQIIVSKIKTTLTVKEIKEWLKGKVSAFKIPKKFYIDKG